MNLQTPSDSAHPQAEISCFDFLKAIDFDRFKAGKVAFLAEGVDLVAQYLPENGAVFSPRPALLPLNLEVRVEERQTLVLDIGGTSTKAAIRYVKDNQYHWKSLFEIKNVDLQLSCKNPRQASFSDYCHVLADEISSKLGDLNLKKEFALGVVWSNGLENYFLAESWGIGARVFNRKNYAKNEWFIQNLKEAEDLTPSFLSAFEGKGLAIDQFVITNDTPATLKAQIGAQAGMVLSTGLNITVLLKPQILGIESAEPFIICNSEIGNSVLVGKHFATEADLLPAGKADTIEHFASGKYFPILFQSYLLAAAKFGCKSLQSLAEYLEKIPDSLSLIRSRDLKDIVNGTNEYLDDSPLKDYLLEPKTKQALAEIAMSLIERSATIGAMLGAISVANILDVYPRPLIAFDSRLAREMPIFWEVYQQELSSCLPEARAMLLAPIKISESQEISVPTQGLANTLDSLKV